MRQSHLTNDVECFEDELSSDNGPFKDVTWPFTLCRQTGRFYDHAKLAF